MDPIATIVMVAMLGTGAAMMMASKGKPRPEDPNLKSKLWLIVQVGVVLMVVFVVVLFISWKMDQAPGAAPGTVQNASPPR